MIYRVAGIRVSDDGQRGEDGSWQSNNGERRQGVFGTMGRAELSPKAGKKRLFDIDQIKLNV